MTEQDNLKHRTWVYVDPPIRYEIRCDKCNGTNIDWSEYEGMIWCFDCKVDTPGTGGVFDGPIPIGAAHLLGLNFCRMDLGTYEVSRPVMSDNKLEWVKITEKVKAGA